jgi:Fe-S-cluster containining protein/ferredoxin
MGRAEAAAAHLDGTKRLAASQTFAFTCHPGVPCFNACCADVNIILTPLDVLQLARSHDHSHREFLGTHPSTQSQGPAAADCPAQDARQAEKRCPFLGAHGCEVYEQRPWACRMYPLGMAIPPARAGEEPEPVFFVFEDDHCQGRQQPDAVQWTTDDWRRDQQITARDELEAGFRELVSHPWFIGGRRQLDPRRIEMFHMACYDLDTFRSFVFDSTFRIDSRFHRAGGPARLTMKRCCLLQWLRFAIFGEPTITARDRSAAQRVRHEDDPTPPRPRGGHRRYLPGPRGGETGAEVVLVERDPTIGGRVVRSLQLLPKDVPPTCGAEINIPARRNPRVGSSSARVTAAEKTGDGWKVTLTIAPAFVNSRCTACGDCEAACVTEVADSFNLGMKKVKAIRLPHLHAWPHRYVFDRAACPDDEAHKIAGACRYAIDLDAAATTETLEVAAVVLATGWKPYLLDRLAELGGSLQDVIANVEMERLASPDGPTAGKIQRPSDGQPPARVAFVQCAGSRDVNHLPYCSGVCCLASLKQATYVKDQLPSGRGHDLLHRTPHARPQRGRAAQGGGHGGRPPGQGQGGQGRALGRIAEAARRGRRGRARDPGRGRSGGPGNRHGAERRRRRPGPVHPQGRGRLLARRRRGAGCGRRRRPASGGRGVVGA